MRRHCRARIALSISRIVMFALLLSTGCSHSTFVEFGVSVLVEEAESQMQSADYVWDHIPASSGLDRTTSNVGLRPEFSEYSDYKLVFWSDTWTSKDGRSSGGWYGWVLVEKPGGLYLIVELGIDQPSHEARLVIDRWDAIYFP